MRYTAVLFGGPEDGKIVQVSSFVPSIVFPVRKTLAQMVQEGEALFFTYYEEVYDYEMHLINTEALYIYRQK
jgi:hypothetical protein